MKFKIILICLVFFILFADISYADQKTSRAASTIDSINGGRQSTPAEIISNIDGTQKTDGGKQKPILVINATVNPEKADRGTYIEITYILKSQKSDLSLGDITINVPNEFENIHCENKNITKNIIKNSNENFHEIHLNGKLAMENPLIFILKAKIPLNASLKNYNISKLINYDRVVYASNATLEVKNNLPKFLKLYIKSYPEALSENNNITTCFAESNITFGYQINDEERNGITLNISINDSKLWNRSTSDYLSEIDYGKIIPGNYSVDISIKDRDGGEYKDCRYIIAINKTYQQDFSEKFFPYIGVIFFLLIICLLIFRLNETLCLNIIESYWDNVIRNIIISLLILWLVLPELLSNCSIKINFLTFISIIYLLISILAIGLIEINFPYDSAKLKCIMPYIGLWKKALYILKKSPLTLAVIFCMTISVLIVGFSLPSNISGTRMDIHYSYIFYYYSAIVQLFGTILSIVVMFTIWYMQDKNQDHGLLEHKSSIIKMLKDFMFLYMSVILLSLCGLALERFPDLNVVGNMNSLASSSALFIFETTMLLVAPAMAALFRLATSFLEISLSKEDNI